MSRRTQTPEEQLDHHDEDAYAEAEEHVSKRRDPDDRKLFGVGVTTAQICLITSQPISLRQGIDYEKLTTALIEPAKSPNICRLL